MKATEVLDVIEIQSVEDWLRPYGCWPGEYEMEAYNVFIENEIETAGQSAESWFDLMIDNKDIVYAVSYDSAVTSSCGRGVAVHVEF